VLIRRLPGSEDLPLPAYQSADAVGMDLHAAAAAEVAPGAVAAVGCGIAIALPPGPEAQVRPRSGLAAKFAVTLANAPGPIDPDYRGEVTVLVINHGRELFRVTRGMRIAQLLVMPVPRVQWREVQELPPTPRGAGGFGHTGA
jgi:dUTP pyrophosphatase